MTDELHQVKMEMSKIEHDAIRACQGLEQHLKGFEDAGAWISAGLQENFGKWQAMHRESVRVATEERFATLELRLMGMEHSVGELKGLQTQMTDFQKSQNSIHALLAKMEA